MILKSAAQKLFKIREEAAKARPGADEGFDPHEKPFLDHLEDLRMTLMQIGATLFISTILCFAFHQQIFELLQWPSKLTKLEDGSLLWDKINFIFLAPQEGLMLMIKVSFFTAVIISMPLLVFFLFQFILPGLRQMEKKMIIPGAGLGFVLFLTGASFAFFLAAPVALKFFFVFENQRFGDVNPAAKALARPIAELPLLAVGGEKIEPFSEKAEALEPTKEKKAVEKIAQIDELPTATEELSPGMKSAIRGYMIDLLAVQQGKDFVLRYDKTRDKIILAHFKGAQSTYQIGKYFEFITRLTLVFGLSFQLPVVVTILVKLELLTARVMRSTRTYAWVIIMVAAAILTPPDIMTLSLLAGPMIVLYEICVIIASIIEKKREKVEKAREEERRSRMERLHSKSPEDLTEEEKAELHKQETEQYEKDHAHLYDDGHQYDENGHLIGYDPDHDHHHGDDGHEHDESWHDDHHYWHEGDENDPHHGETEPEPVQDWPDKETEPGAESDHAEPVSTDEPEEADATDEAEKPDATDEAEKPDPEESQNQDDDCCEPSGPVVDINYATREEVMDLPGMDESLADMVIDHRPYYSFDELEEIVGPDHVSVWMERLMLG